MTLLVLDLSSAGPWVGLAMSGACVAAVGYLLGRRRTTKPGFRAREIGGWLVRSAAPSDAGHIHRMVKELAEFEKMGDGAKLTVSDFSDHLASGSFECLLLEMPSSPGHVVGMAAYFETYSTWQGKCVYLEDLYISSVARGKGGGTAMLRAVATVAQERVAARLQWVALDWNDKAIEFYKSPLVGARERVEEDGAKWVNFIMTKPDIAKLAAAA